MRSWFSQSSAPSWTWAYVISLAATAVAARKHALSTAEEAAPRPPRSGRADSAIAAHALAVLALARRWWGRGRRRRLRRRGWRLRAGRLTARGLRRRRWEGLAIVAERLCAILMPSYAPVPVCNASDVLDIVGKGLVAFFEILEATLDGVPLVVVLNRCGTTVVAVLGQRSISCSPCNRDVSKGPRRNSKGGKSLERPLPC